ncbi:hypothetical protein KTF61_00735 [Faecalibacterium prausnitzii]|uniref:hypothetical protein n=1 Tax=Faecalibacterium prausnitzii TaxID=853 RepID=UPI001C27BAD9|nr:hypothetical protein [Faecalibacterium prausnitzii]MBU8988130.1 hypothetical protein [Faecalibacterium prausnitzii]MCQ5154830.1 hypothetical protein [Faecalibacterium prausnitzii]
MKYADINRRVTEIVADYIQRGYSINTATMEGSQGEVASIDLTDGKNVIRIFVQRFWLKDDLYNDGYELIVGEADRGIRAHQPAGRMYETIWNNKLNVIRSDEFYEIGKTHGRPAWFGSRDEAVAAENIRVNRYAHRYEPVSKDSLSDYAAKIAKRYICRVTGIKHPNRAKINVRHAIRRDDGRVYGQYIVTYNGKSYILH